MIISIAVVVLSILICQILSRHGVSLSRKAIAVVFALEAVGVIYTAYTSYAYCAGFDGTLRREDVGGRDYEEILSVQRADDTNEPREIEVEVKARVPTADEAFDYIDIAIAEIESGMLGENMTTSEVTKDLLIKKAYAGGMVEAEWFFDGHGLIDQNGRIRWERFEEPTTVEAICELSCGDYSSNYELTLTVIEPDADTEEGFFYRLNRSLNEADDVSRSDEVMRLPDEVDDESLVWSRNKDNTGIMITFFGAAAGGALVVAEREEEKRKHRQNAKELSIDYPEIVSRLSLYVGAGFGVKAGFERIGEQYLLWRSAHADERRPGYEAVVAMNRKMSDGMGEAEAYRLLGEDTGHKSYRKLSLLLRQNLRKGSRDMIEQLEKEERIAYEEKRTAARIAGEEASTKLLLPMMMLLSVLLAVLIVPAWVGMGIA